MIIWSLSYVCIAPAVRIITTVYTPSLCVLLVPSYIGRAGNEICQLGRKVNLENSFRKPGSLHALRSRSASLHKKNELC